MPHTVFPKGVTVSTSTTIGVRTVDGEVYADTLNVAGTVVGQVLAIPVIFGVASTAQVYSVPVPFTGDLIGAYVTVGSVSAVAAAYTVRIGSAGTVLVSSEANTITTSYAQESLTIDSAGVTSAAGLQVTRGVQGTTGDTTLLLLLKRTA